MKSSFSQQVMGVSPEQTRAALSQKEQTIPEKTMVEREQLAPELKPHGFGEDSVDRQLYQARLDDEQARYSRYQIRVSEVHTRIHMNGQLVNSHVERQVSPIVRSPYITHEFNMQSAQAQDAKERDIAY